LANAAITNCNIALQLINSNQQLTATNRLLTEQLQKALATNATLVQKMGTTTLTTVPTPTGNGRQPFNMAEWEAKLDLTGYCWLHGYTARANWAATNQRPHMQTSKEGKPKENDS
jgi:hypothetical protein